jgi:O-antigen ligase
MFQRLPLTGAGIGNYARYRILHVDGVAANAHSLPGELLGETGTLGTIAFLMLIAGLFVNYRATSRLARGRPEPRLEMLSDLAGACWQSMLLLLFFGLFSHNMLRFNWVFLGALALLCRKLAKDIHNAGASGAAQ